MEEKIQKFYLDSASTSAEMSKSLLVDISQLFEKVAQKRNNRKIQLESIH